MSRVLGAIAVAALVTCSLDAGVVAQSSQASGGPALPLRLRAWAVSMGTMATGANAMIEITINRWSTAKERETLIATFLEKGQDKLLDALQKQKSLGRMRYPNVTGRDPQNRAIGYDLRYAWHRPAEDGGDMLVIAFDRYVSFQEAVNNPRVSDYPFTFIQIHLPKEGKGEGRMAVATRLDFNKKKNAVELENYSSEPVRLNQIEILK
jgi:hypothetical protein